MTARVRMTWQPIETAPFVHLDKLDIRGDVIHYWLYAQDGSKVPMTCPDTLHNRQFVAWCKIHDRYAEPPK